MYKKIALFSALLCSLTLYGYEIQPWLEIKPSYFFFSSSPMNEIYNHGGFEIQGSGSVPVCEYFDFYSSIGYRQAWGHALNSGEKTSLTVIPFDIGLKPVCKFHEKYHAFFAFGPRFFFFHQKNDSPYVQSVINSGGVGLFVNTGFNVQLAQNFLLGLFGEYSYESKTISPSEPNVFSNGNMQLGGYAFGVSLGYEF